MASSDSTPSVSVPVDAATVMIDGGCSSQSTQVVLKEVSRHKEPIVIGRATLTGHVKASAGTSQAQMGGPNATYSEVRLTELASLNGVSVPGSLRVYVPGGTDKGVETKTGDSVSSSWAQDGMFFGFITQTETVGPVLTALPLANGEVIFTGTGCWNLENLSTALVDVPIVKVISGRAASSTSSYPAASVKALSAFAGS